VRKGNAVSQARYVPAVKRKVYKVIGSGALTTHINSKTVCGRCVCHRGLVRAEINIVAVDVFGEKPRRPLKFNIQDIAGINTYYCAVTTALVTAPLFGLNHTSGSANGPKHNIEMTTVGFL
jgi:hypothetical protein